ncbi:glycosyltransferase [Devosia sp.]|uniref:glycosyltransferase n=1 Tax=Devosia sp. TaxID=1871048 RepID=UPI002AFF1EC0|nr:glycosyltransferase [Devosia sp.]
MATISVIIKALNEEAHIRRCIESILPLRASHDVQIILADSLSTDNTIAYAADYPIDIVQLRNPAERSCGIGAQLGFQHSIGDYLYIIDGDMELFPGFIDEALAQFALDPKLAGIGGLVEEHGAGNYEFERRAAMNDGLVPGGVEALDMGGLYRRTALVEVGYFTNRNLHSYEEKELGFRLGAAGFTLKRLPVWAVRHHGKTSSTGALLASRWTSRHFQGSGELLRSAIGTPYLGRVARLFWRLLLIAASYGLALVGLILLSPLLLLLALGFHLLVAAYLLVRERDGKRAAIGYINLNILTLAMLGGLLSRPRDPAAPIEDITVKTYGHDPRS